MNYNQKHYKDLAELALNMEWENSKGDKHLPHSLGREFDALEALMKEGLVAVRTSRSSGIVFEKSTKRIVFVYFENNKSRNRGWDIYCAKPIFKYVYDDDEFQELHPLENYKIPERYMKGYNTHKKSHPKTKFVCTEKMF